MPPRSSASRRLTSASKASASSDLVTPRAGEALTHPLSMSLLAKHDSSELSNSLAETTREASPASGDGTVLHATTTTTTIINNNTNTNATTKSSEQQQPEDLDSSVVLVAKRLTNSDASSGRIILPRVAVETNLSFVVAYRHYGMHVRDAWGETHEFVVKSWANGSESRRVFVLEGVGKFLKQHHVGVGDVVGICAHGDEFLVEVNTEEVKQAASSTGRSSAASTPRAGGGDGTPRFSFGRPLLSNQNTSNNSNILPVHGGVHDGGHAKCARSAKCTKGNGHAGFCSGPKAAAVRTQNQNQNQNHTHNQSHSSGNTSDYSTIHHWGEDELEDEHQEVYVDQVFVGEDAVNADMQQLPDGLHRLVYIPERVKVVKQLTEYDLSSRRVVLPADQASRGFLLAEGVNVYTLAAVDESQGWHFPTVRCWKSVTQRAGYFLEDAAGLLAARGARPGDYFMIFRDSIHAPPKIMVLDGDTCAVKKPALGPDAHVDFLALPILLLPYGEHGDLVAGGPSTVRDVKRWHNGKLGGCCKSVCCLLEQDHRGGCAFDDADRTATVASASASTALVGRKRAAGEYESTRTPSHRERRGSTRFAGGPDPLVSLLNLLE